MKTAGRAEANRPGGASEIFVTTSDQADRRLDRVLRTRYPDVPLGAIMKAMRCGAVRVNGARAEGSLRLAAGDEVFAPWPAAERPTALRGADGSHSVGYPEDGEPLLRTILRTDDIWCVDKPAGLLSQPDRPGGDSVVTRAWRELSWRREDFRPATAGRLDRNVSGVMLIALNAPILRTFSELVREGLIKKIYRAVVLGQPPSEGEISLPLLKDERANKASSGKDGRSALTRFRTLEPGRDFSLVELELVTGRPHQARFHMSSIGCPIAGDFKYGDRRPEKARGRLLLHAYSISLPDTPILPPNLRGRVIIAEMPKKFTKAELSPEA
ncbi:MAG: RluA family pseudouridine synthase [Synergistaceae bacterium]|jgi:23S rRNA pseudouridine955/2504/2580 synthase|nr:RluA family pseudouridine synthase [Synergistaceae bacterium]